MNRNGRKSPSHARLPVSWILAATLLVGCAGSGKQILPDQLADEMSKGVAAVTLAEQRNGVIPRFNQSKSIACLTGEFRVRRDIPQALQQGIFSRPVSYPAMLRFASASEQDDSRKDIRGLSIRVSGVEGVVLWGEPGRQDFLLNSHPALFVSTPEEFLSFIHARQSGDELKFFLNPAQPRPKSLAIVSKARKRHLSPLDIRYWSTVPFRLGENQAQVVKYSVTPCSGYTTTSAVDAGENQLRAAVKAHLQQTDACFHFGIQRQTDPDSMPVEDAAVIWDERLSPFETVATIVIEPQTFDDPESLAACERSSFNPWQSLKAHEPLGRMNQVRRVVYDRAEKLRNKE
jgi:catalase